LPLRSTITASSFNDIVTGINEVLGSNTDRGYGSQLTVQSVTTGTTIRSAPWVAALADIRRCWIHQRGTLTGFPTVAAITSATSNTTVVTAAFADQLQSLVTTIRNDSINVAPSQLARATTPTYTVDTWPTKLQHIVDSVFNTAADASYFFNSGGSLGFELTYSTSTAVWNTQTQAWAATLDWAKPIVAADLYTRGDWSSGNRSTNITLTSGSNRLSVGFSDISDRGIRAVLTVTNIYVAVNIAITSTAVVSYSVDTVGVVDSTDLNTYIGIRSPQPTQTVQAFFSDYQDPVIPSTRILSFAFSGGSGAYTVEEEWDTVYKTVTITNSGNTTATVSAITFDTQYPMFDHVDYNLGWGPPGTGVSTINPGSTVDFRVGYSATIGAVGTYATNSFVIVSNNDTGPLVIKPTITLVAPIYRFTISPNPLVIAWTGESNLGAYFDAVEKNGAGNYAGSTVGTDANIWDSVGTNANQLKVRFKPLGVNYATGTYPAVLSFTMQGPDGQTVTNTANITVNYTAPAVPVTQNLGTWVSALQNDNGVIGASYDILNGKRYITIGYGMNADGGGTVAATAGSNVSVAYLGYGGDSVYDTLIPVLYAAPYHYGYHPFLNPFGPGNLDGHGAWINDTGWYPVNTWVSRTYTFNTARSGNHSYRLSSDNLSKFTVDGGIIADRSGFVDTNTPVTGSFYLVAGDHTLTIYMYNIDNGYYNSAVNPGAMALEINDPVGVTVWSTLWPIRSFAPYRYWNEVYRIPVDGAVTRYSKDYLIKGFNSANGNTYGSYFGQPGTADEGSMFVVTNDGVGNITIRKTDQYVSTTDATSQTTMSYTRYLFYYYSEAGQRITNLESKAGDGNTRFFLGFLRSGTVNTNRVIIPTPAGGSGGGSGGGGGGGGSCPDPATPIVVSESGLTQPAGELTVGVTVWTRHETTGVFDNYPITAIQIVEQPRVQIQFDDGTGMIVSDSHRFLMWDLAWRQVFQLVPGDTIKGWDTNKSVVGMAPLGVGPVVMMTVDRAHTYIADGLISHNVKIIP